MVQSRMRRGEVFIYYASSDTRMHVATTTIDKLVDYVFHTLPIPEEAWSVWHRDVNSSAEMKSS